MREVFGCYGEEMYAHWTVAGKPEEMRAVGRSERTWEDKVE